jgi:hypothetical protein
MSLSQTSTVIVHWEHQSILPVPRVKHAKYIIAQVNKQMPRTHGDGIIHIKDIHALVQVDEALPEVFYSKEITDDSIKIGKFCAELIEDRSCLANGYWCYS